MSETTKINDSFLYTNKTALAAAMVAIGFQFKPTRALIRTYTTKKPKGTTGVFFYRLETTNPSLYVKNAEVVMAEWEKKNADVELQAKIKEVGDFLDRARRAFGADPNGAIDLLGKAQQALADANEKIPAAYIAVCSQAELNRQDITNRLMAIVKSDEDGPYTQLDHGGGRCTLIPHDCPREIALTLIEAAKRK